MSPLQAERRPQPARDAFQKPRDYFAEGTCRRGQPPFPVPRGRAPALCPSRRQPSWGARGGRSGPGAPPGTPAAALSRGPGLTPALVLPAVRRPQDGTFFKGPPYPGYPFLMIPDLSSPYLPNGPLSPGGARTVSACRTAPGRVGGPAGVLCPRAR